MTHRAIYPEGLSCADIPLKLSPGIISNGHLFLTGLTGSAKDGSMPSDPETQFRALFTKILGLLNAAHLDFGAVVEMTSYHVDIAAHFDTFEMVHGLYVQSPYPAWTAVEVAGLRRHGALAEVRVIAAVPK